MMTHAAVHRTFLAHQPPRQVRSTTILPKLILRRSCPQKREYEVCDVDSLLFCLIRLLIALLSLICKVAIRMRPLNDNEGQHKRVWEVFPQYASVTQTTPEGRPLKEKIIGRTFFTFDETFSESNRTEEVYTSMAKGVVRSVITGLNGVIFTYGQTSSGKTYTMQGCSITGQDKGILQMAASDIFHSIQKSKDRIFLVRVSFLEIYNEDIRDLLATGRDEKLAVREDPQRGVFVPSQEEIVVDLNALESVLLHGNKKRSIASTAMNEHSSRSHTVFRITIESRAKEPTDSCTERSISKRSASGYRGTNTDGVLVSTLDLVDLAGSESVRHTGASGDRQKEGGMINQRYVLMRRKNQHSVT